MAVFMFSGQGAQKPGMGADLLDVPEVAQAFAQAKTATGVDAAALAATADAATINDSLNAQVLTVALSVGLARALAARGVTPEAVVGFSLGQISALIATEALSAEEGFALLNVRSRALARAAEERAGGMLALLGATHEDAQAVCDACAGAETLVCANYNAPGQVVVSGDIAAIDRAEAQWKQASKRCARLNTAGAFHSPLMASAAEKVGAFCKTLTFREPKVALICNTDAAPFVADEAAARLSAQIVSPVLFEQSIASLYAQGHTAFTEVGFGGVLHGLVRRIERSAERNKVGTLEELDAYAPAN